MDNFDLAGVGRRDGAAEELHADERRQHVPEEEDQEHVHDRPHRVPARTHFRQDFMPLKSKSVSTKKNARSGRGRRASEGARKPVDAVTELCAEKLTTGKWIIGKIGAVYVQF